MNNKGSKICMVIYPNKKGFTLVELAIVLVVIGLLMGMAFKGKTLIESARAKADYQKINKIEAALNIYNSKYGTLPGLVKSGPDIGNISPKLFYKAIIDEGLLQASDFKVTSMGVAFLNIVGCQEVSDGAGNLIWRVMNAREDTGICVYNTNISPEFMEDSNNIAFAKASPIPKYLACQLETLADDRNVHNGDGRVIEGGNGPLDIPNYDCSRYANDSGTEGSDGAYAFRIF